MPTVKRKERPPTKWVKELPETLVAWGNMPGSRDPDDPDREVVVAGLRLVRAPDGTFVGVVEPKVTP
jgi:hypothetical protein